MRKTKAILSYSDRLGKYQVHFYDERMNLVETFDTEFHPVATQILIRTGLKLKDFFYPNRLKRDLLHRAEVWY